MTNREDGEDSHDCKPRMAALLAVHLVSQVLDEAYVIANAANESGQPWNYLSMLKSFKTSRLSDIDDEDASFEASNGDCDVKENKMDTPNIVATSTPQKFMSRVCCSDESDVSNAHYDTTIIGQGDEDLEVQNDLAKSTSMFINHLFDMSDVERIVICDDTEIIQSTSEPNDLLQEAMNKIMESYVAKTMTPLHNFPLQPDVIVTEGQAPVELPRTVNSEYSFLADAFVADISRDVAFYIDDELLCSENEHVRPQPAIVEEMKEQDNESSDEMIQKHDVALYENAYVTLNRDYDQCSEEDGFPILQDPKGMTLQEVELMTASTSDDDLSYPELKVNEKAKEVPATISCVSGSRKSTLARRCRIQGARLLACFRGWWRRKSPGKRKETRCPGMHGMCPLSPDARRRASSLIDNRHLRSPSPSRPVVWKFNTVNEAVVNSNRWKDYTFDIKPEDCSDY